MKDNIRERVFKEGLEVKFPISPDIITWWINRFSSESLLRPKNICEQLSKDINLTKKYLLRSVDIMSECVTVEIKALDNIEEVLFAQRSIEFQNNQLHQDFLEILERYQGNGLGRILARNSILLAMKLNLKRLGVIAVDTGSYVWARAGFLPESTSWRSENCLGKIFTCLNNLEGVPWELKNEVYSRLNPGRPSGIWYLSDLTEIVTSTRDPNLQLPIGKVLLMESGATWRGHLEFKTQDGEETRHIRRARTYLRL
ncbi:hypothetical protein [Roseibium litorale]|uniref:N-acetyltransferase domain-containing protein n=1 Tax=Roseibium litorale TaxID=2803841 RepID=A0ABR9CWI6_9HYPH|nr:hypothetical protein [Roseibium litorale]MBD8894371.1 hypothetical protein [Roseibium litorale]